MKTLRLLGALFVLLTFAGCGLDIGDGSQLTGQRCFADGDCADGLVCNQRVCVASLGSRGPAPDAGNNSANNTANNTTANNTTANNISPNNISPNNISPNNVTDMGCAPGERRCASESVVQVCGENGEIGEEVCPPNSVCENGQCERIGPNCIDEDGDGYGPGCPRGEDCDVEDPLVNPGVPEFCFNDYDDNCDGMVNEGCDPDGCCVGGCGNNEFCSQACECQPFDPAVCQYQNQPCFNEGEFENGFVCANFNPGVGQARCWGLCTIDADNPDATCPEPGSVCAFDAGDGQNGICMSPCATDPATGQATGCDAGLGCINVDVGAGDGICVPTNPNNGRGDRCDEDFFFDCDEGLLCLQGFQGRGRCRESCRPFFWGGMATDCDIGHCLPFSSAIGACFQDNNDAEGESCGPPQSACGADAVGCYGGGMGNQQQCLRICRLDEGNDDCFDPSQNCEQFDNQQEELGICF